MQISQQRLEKHACRPFLVGHWQKFSLLFISIKLPLKGVAALDMLLRGVASLDMPLSGEIAPTGDSHLEITGEIIENGETHLDTFVVEGGVVNRLCVGVAIFVKSGWEAEEKESRGRDNGDTCGYTRL